MNDIFSLKGKNAVIIGGGGGIGKAIAKGYAFYGAQVAIASRSREGLEKAASEIEAETGAKVQVFTVDSADPESIRQLVSDAVAAMGRVDILVNSQGYNPKYPALEFPLEEWDKTYDVNVRGVMLCCVEFARHMKEIGGGRIINVSSIRADRAAPGGGSALAYGTSKGAVNMLTKQLAAEFASMNITVNALGPTVTKTAMMEKVIEKNPAFEERMIAKIPLGRLALPEDNIGPAVFFASEAGSFFTGACAYVDGGLASVG